MMMRCVEILRSIDGFTSCTAVQPHGTAVEVIRLHSSRTNFVFCEPPIRIYHFFVLYLDRQKVKIFNHMIVSGHSGTLAVN